MPKFFVSFAVNDPVKGMGYGNTDVSIHGPLTMDTIREIEQIIQVDADGHSKITLLNVVPLEED